MQRSLSILLCFFLLTNVLNAQQKKNTAAVLNFVNSGGVDKNEINILTNRFSNYLVNAGVYKILEREKMDAILKEQDFSMTDNCNSSECALQIGQLLGVERMITGNIGLFGQMWTLDVRVVDVSTGEILKTQSENYEGRKEGLLGAIESLAYSVSGKTAPLQAATKTTTEKTAIENSFTDPRDGKTYKTVKIGNQVWMTENLNYDAGSGSYCYDDNSANCDKYGKLYTWEAAKRAAPPGWHLPTDAEWKTLTTYLGGESVAGGKLKEAGLAYWASPNTGATNETGFTTLPGGFRYINGPFYGMGNFGYWWSSTEYDTTDALYRSMFCNLASVFSYYLSKANGFSVRCVRD